MSKHCTTGAADSETVRAADDDHANSEKRADVEGPTKHAEPAKADLLAYPEARKHMEDFLRVLLDRLEPGEALAFRSPGQNGSWHQFRRPDRKADLAAGVLLRAVQTMGLTSTYVHLNPARAGEKGQVNAHQITRRLWVVIDADPEKADANGEVVADGHATDAEKTAAGALTDHVHGVLRDHGFGDPAIVVDTGNGFHSWYPIELANDDKSKRLVKELLSALERAAGGQFGAKIDQKLSDAPRLVRVPGTVNRKFVGTPDRPQRPARLILANSRPPVPVERIRQFVAEYPEPKQQSRASKPTGPSGAGASAYGRAALQREVEAMASAVAGERNDQLNKSAFALGQLIAGRELDEATARDELTAAARSVGLDDAEIAKTLKSGLEAGKLEPRQRPDKHARATRGESPTSDGASQRESAPKRRSILQYPAQLRDVRKQAVDALVENNDINGPSPLFSYGDTLVVVDQTAEGQPVRHLTKPQMQLRLSDVADWMSEKGTGENATICAAFPKREIVDSVLCNPEWLGVPRLKVVVDVPILTHASGLLEKPGYDAASGVYVLPSGHVSVDPVPSHPTDAELSAALSLILDELLGDFPFADDASRANALALFLLPFVRDLIDGPTPLHHIDAPQEGTGKSLLVGTWGTVAFGRAPEAIAEASKPEEWQKTVFAKLLEAPTAIYLDNIGRTLDSTALASALTESHVGGRILSTSRMGTVPVRCAWVSTGNNVNMSREIVRRTVYIRLDARKDAAWKGRAFRHQLPRWAKLNRGKLVSACLTLCQAWAAAGRPPGRELLGRYESWSAVTDGILTVAGILHLLGNDKEFRDNVSDGQDELRAFIGAWWRANESRVVGVAELYELASRADMLNELFSRAKGNDVEKSRRTILGKEISKLRGRTFDGLRLELAGKDNSGRATYRLIDQRPRGDQGAEL